MMNALRLQLLAHAPNFMRRQALLQLYNATTAAFDCDAARLRGVPYIECLHRYACFTASQAETVLRRGDLVAAQDQLYRHAHRLGRLTGRLLRVRTVPDVMAVSCLLYGVIGIDFEGDTAGNIIIRRCYFSDFYTAEVCRVMAAMDRGLLAGLSGGGELVFSARITEGHACCHAHFAPVQEWIP